MMIEMISVIISRSRGKMISYSYLDDHDKEAEGGLVILLEDRGEDRR